MAHPPPKPPPAAPPVDPKVAHDAAVANLERALDASLKGKRAAPGEPVWLHLPVGDHAAEVLTEVCAHYVAAGWGQAVTHDEFPVSVFDMFDGEKVAELDVARVRWDGDGWTYRAPNGTDHPAKLPEFLVLWQSGGALYLTP